MIIIIETFCAQIRIALKRSGSRTAPNQNGRPFYTAYEDFVAIEEARGTTSPNRSGDVIHTNEMADQSVKSVSKPATPDRKTLGEMFGMDRLVRFDSRIPSSSRVGHRDSAAENDPSIKPELREMSSKQPENSQATDAAK